MKPLRATPRDKAVLRDLWLFRYLSTRQISRLHFGHVKLAQRRLRTLAENRLVDRFQPGGARQAGFRTWWYRLANRGARIVAGGEDVRPEDILPPVRRPRSWHFVAHHALVTDFRVWLREGLNNSEFSAGFIPAYEEVKGQRRPRIALEVPGHVRLLIPDGVFMLQRGEMRALFMLEVDRGTEPLTGKHKSSITRKLQRYRAAFDARKEEHFEKLFDANFNGFRILCLVPDRQRLEAFLRLAARMDLTPLVWVTTSSLVEETGDLDQRCWAITIDDPPHALTE